MPASLGLMLLATALGLGAVLSAPSDTHIGGMWPVGLVSGLLVYVGRRSVPVIAGALLVLVFGTFALGGYPLGVSAAYAVAIVARGLGHRQGPDGAVGLRPSPQRRPRPGQVHPGLPPRRRHRCRAVRPHRGDQRLRDLVGGVRHHVRHPPRLAADPARLLHGGVPAPGRERPDRDLGPMDGGGAGHARCLRPHPRAWRGLLRPACDRLGRTASADARGAVAARGRGHHREHADPVRPRPVRGHRAARQATRRARQRAAAGIPARVRTGLPALRHGRRTFACRTPPRW